MTTVYAYTIGERLFPRRYEDNNLVRAAFGRACSLCKDDVPAITEALKRLDCSFEVEYDPTPAWALLPLAIDEKGEYVTRSGKPVMGIQVNDRKYTFPASGTIILGPRKSEHALWLADGHFRLDGTDSPMDLVPKNGK